MKWCSNCVLPDSRPNLIIGPNGVCNACLSHSDKIDINWNDRYVELCNILKKVKVESKNYHCVIPVSGGKDSTWQVVKILELGLKPLCVTWKPPGRTRIGQNNLNNLISLGVDHIDFSISPKVEAKFALKAFEEIGVPAVPMHMAIFNIPITIALKFDIPLVIWGENSAEEYGSKNSSDKGGKFNKAWVQRYGVSNGMTAIDWVSNDLTEQELLPYFGPSDEEIKEAGLDAIFLGHYLEWDPEVTRKTASENGFKASQTGPRTGYYNFADIDDDFISIHHWLKWYKFGFTRLFDNLSIEIRNGRLSRDKALKIIQETGLQTPIDDIIKFCNFVGISQDAFFNKAEKFRNHTIWHRMDNNIWTIPDFIIPDWRWN